MTNRKNHANTEDYPLFYDDVNPWTKGKNPQFRMCLYSWKKACPDYALMLWHEKVPSLVRFCNSRYLSVKHMNLSYGRLFPIMSVCMSLTNTGAFMWIRMFSCCKTLTSFWMTVFVSIESDIHRQENVPEPAVMGSTPGHPLIAETMKLYQSEQVFEIKKPMIPLVMKKVLAEMSGFARVPYDSSQLAFAVGELLSQ